MHEKVPVEWCIRCALNVISANFHRTLISRAEASSRRSRTYHDSLDRWLDRAKPKHTYTHVTYHWVRVWATCQRASDSMLCAAKVFAHYIWRHVFAVVHYDTTSCCFFFYFIFWFSSSLAARLQHHRHRQRQIKEFILLFYFCSIHSNEISVRVWMCVCVVGLDGRDQINEYTQDGHNVHSDCCELNEMNSEHEKGVNDTLLFLSAHVRPWRQYET